MNEEMRPLLLVEDNPDDIELTRDALEQHGIANPLIVATDGVQALDYLATADPLPRLVLLDLNLPRVNGLEVLKRMRSETRTSAVPVVILTTSREDQDLIDGYRFGANSYVQKPVNFIEFHEAVRTLGMYWLLLNEDPPAQALAS